MPAPFPHRYSAELVVKDDRSSVLQAPARPPIVAGNPPEFDGQAEWWSPEHLLLGALQTCFRGTFDALAGRAGVKPKSYATRAEALLEKTAAGIVFTQIKLIASVEVESAQVDTTKELLAKAKKYCITSNQLKTEPTLELDVKAG